ncbi:MAG: dihydrofolate reductase [Lachnospiraceae bacterium]|nr:dihydrofolate reductase [Lachnospiraceae bacterium]
MKAIAAVDKNWGIGCDNKLLVRIPADMQFFKETTMNNVVIMGRSTLESFPGKRPLPNRVNIVLTRNADYEAKDVIVVHSVKEAIAEAAKYEDKETFIIGGGMIYEQFLPYCDTAYITYVDHAYRSDTMFPNLEQMPEWRMTEESEEQTYFDLEYYFRTYKREK